MTPFDIAGQEYLNTSQHNALDTLGDQGAVNAARSFELLAQQKQSDNAKSRETDRLRQEAAIRESQRQQLRNEDANTIYAKAGYKPDPEKSLEENKQAAIDILNDKQVDAFKVVVGNKQKSDAELLNLATRNGYNPPSDKEVSLKLLDDPSLASLFTGSNSFGYNGPAIRAGLAAGKSIDEIFKGEAANYVGASKDRTTLLAAFDNAKQALIQRNQQIAINQSGIEGQLAQSHSNVNNQLIQDLLTQASPELRARMATEMSNQNVTPPTPAWVRPPPPTPNPVPTSDQYAGQFVGPPAPVANSATPTLPPVAGEDPKYSPNTYAPVAQKSEAQQNLEDELANNQSIAGDIKHVEGVMNGGYMPSQSGALSMGGLGGVGLPPTLSEKLTPGQLYNYGVQHRQLLEKKNKSDAKVLKLSDAFRNSGLPSGQPSTTSLVSPAPTVPSQPFTFDGFNSGGGSFGGNVSNPVSAGAPDPNNAMAQLNVKNTLTRVFGTSDPVVLAKARAYAKSKGATDEQLNQQLQAAVNGDPQAIQSARQVIGIVSGQGNSTPSLSPPVAQPSAVTSPPIADPNQF